MKIQFSKMHGLGNDFVVIDAINQKIQLTAEQIVRWSDRHFGIGFDQLLLVEKPETAEAEFKYRIFNADGSEVAQCGNGARCFARFVHDKGMTKSNPIRVDTDSGPLLLSLNNQGSVTVNMGVPRFEPSQIPLDVPHRSPSYVLQLEDQVVPFFAVSMGNPHAVIRVENVETAPVAAQGQLIESHTVFPQRVNVGFMQVVDRQTIKLRVYERGAAETLACGSGACAAVVAGIEQGWLDSEVKVSLPGGELTVSWNGVTQSVMMTGPAEFVFDGVISTDEY